MSNNQTVQDILVLFQDSPGLDGHVFGWSRYYASDLNPTIEDEEMPPYKTAIEAMRDGWRVVQMSELKDRSADEAYTVGVFRYQTVLEKFTEMKN